MTPARDPDPPDAAHTAVSAKSAEDAIAPGLRVRIADAIMPLEGSIRDLASLGRRRAGLAGTVFGYALGHSDVWWVVHDGAMKYTARDGVGRWCAEGVAPYSTTELTRLAESDSRPSLVHRTTYETLRGLCHIIHAGGEAKTERRGDCICGMPDIGPSCCHLLSMLKACASADAWIGLSMEIFAETAAIMVRLERAERACTAGLPREVIPCPQCGKPHIDGDFGEEFRTRPHHTHTCGHCGHIWDSGRWSFGRAPT